MLIVLVAHAIWFVIAQIKDDNGVIDIQWGLSFIASNIVVIMTRIQNGGAEKNVGTRLLITNILVAIWGLRMTIHVSLRICGGEVDRRF